MRLTRQSEIAIDDLTDGLQKFLLQWDQAWNIVPETRPIDASYIA